MKRLLPVLACFILLLLSSTEGWSADFQKGLDAYKSGDYGTALSEWEPLAKDLVFNPLGEEANARSQWGLGMMYENGHGVTQNYKTAVKWYKLSANQGYAPALTNLKRLQKKMAAEAERKRKVKEAHRLAELKRKRIEAEARRLIELERKRKEEEARRLAEAERKEEEARLAAAEAERKRKEEEARLAAAEAERKRKEEEARLAEAERKVEEARLAVLEAERKRKAEAEQKLFAKFEPQAIAHLKDVQMFIKKKPTSPDLLAISTAAVGLKKSLETKNGDAIRAQIKAFQEKVVDLSDFIEFRKLLVAKREQAAKELAARKAKEAEELAAKKAREEALIIAKLKRKLATYRQELVTMLSNSISNDSTMAEALIPIIRLIEVGVKNTVKSEVSRVLASVEEQIKTNKKIKKIIEESSKPKAQGKNKASPQPGTKNKEAGKSAVQTNFLIGMCVSTTK